MPVSLYFSFFSRTELSISKQHCLIPHLAWSLESHQLSRLVRVFSLPLALLLLCSTYSVLWNAATHERDTCFQKALEMRLMSRFNFVKGPIDILLCNTLLVSWKAPLPLKCNNLQTLKSIESTRLQTKKPTG